VTARSSISAASGHRSGSSKWSKVGAANGRISKLLEEAIQSYKRELFWCRDLNPNGFPISGEIDDEASANLARPNAHLSSAAPKIEVRREWPALTVRYFKVLVFHGSTGNAVITIKSCASTSGSTMTSHAVPP
jgi:hypothetical protein